MDNTYITPARGARSEFTEKRSRFIGHCAPVSSENEALAFVNEIKSLHKTATHNVWAYTVRENNLCRFTDDGEPSGTAGLPVLDALRNREVCDAAIVVTRYFGGTLLGTGGLVRAYSRAACEALDAAGLVCMALCREYELCMNYSDYERVQKLLSSLEATVCGSDFGESVRLCVACAAQNEEKLAKELRELTAGRVVPNFLEEKFAALKQN